MDLTNTGVCNPGGGALCASQAGSLKALHEFYTYHKAKPLAVRGSSGGDLNSCLFVQAFADDGDSIFLMEKLWKTISHRKVHTLIPHIYPRTTGLFKLTPLYKTLIKLIDPKKLIDTGIDFKVRATRYGGGQDIEIGPDNAAFFKMVLASASYPAVFRPQKIWGSYWADTGLSCNLPLDRLIHAGCTKLFIMHIEKSVPKVIKKNDLRLIRILGRIISEMMESHINIQLNEIEQINQQIELGEGSPKHKKIELINIVPAEYTTRPLHVMEFNSKRCGDSFDNGYRSARKFLNNIN